jgi:hypothetical protein
LPWLVRSVLYGLLALFVFVARLTPLGGPSVPFLLWSVPALPVLIISWILLPPVVRRNTRYLFVGVSVLWVGLLAVAIFSDRYLVWTGHGFAVIAAPWTYVAYLGFPPAVVGIVVLVGSRAAAPE